MVEISKRTVLINSASSVATQVLHFSVLVWLQQFLLRRITPEEYALYPVVTSVMVFSPLLTVFLTSGLGRFVVVAHSKEDDRQVTQIVTTMFPILSGAGFLVLGLGWWFAWNVGSVLTIPPEYIWDARIMLAALMFTSAIRLPLAPFSVGLYVQQKFVLQNVIQIAVALFRISLIFFFLFCISTRVIWVVVASVCSDVIGLVIELAISRRLVPSLRFRPGEFRSGIAKDLVSFGGWNFVGDMAGSIRDNADPIILNKLSTPLDVTCFYLGSQISRVISTLTGQAMQVVSPALTAMYARGNKEQVANTYLRGSRYGLWMILFFSIPAMIYRREVITLYVGEKYMSAAMVMLLLMARFPFSRANTIMMTMLAEAAGKVRTINLFSMLLHTINILLTLYLVGVLNMGAVGSALPSFLVVAIGQPILYYPLGWKMAGVSPKRWLRETLVPGLLPGLVGCVAWYGLREFSSPHSWLMLAAWTACGCACYMGVLLGFCLSPNDRTDLIDVVSRVRARLIPC